MVKRLLHCLAVISCFCLWGMNAWGQENPRIPEKLTLKAAQTLLQGNPSLQASRLEIEAEKADLIGAEKYPNPSLSFLSDGWVLGSDRGSFIDRFQPSLTVRQEIPTAGKRGKRVRIEQVDAEIASMRMEDLKRQLNSDLKRTYFEIVLFQHDLDLASEILDRFQEIVRLNQTRHAAGEISGGELRRSEAAEYRLFAEVVNAETRLGSAKSELVALLGSTDFSRPFDAVDGFETSFLPPPELDLRETALRQRPDLAVARAEIRRSDSVIEFEQARSKPNIAAIGGYKRELDSSGPVLGIEVPLFVSNRNQGPTLRARIGKQVLENRLLFRQLNMFKEVRTALQRLEGDRRRVDALEQNYLKKAEQARDITEASYRLGEASLIEFLDAQRTYVETRLLYNRARYDFEISRATLELAMGEDL
jgi:cobalt-zinc-cadmium efflux system outer membrane protein